MDPKKIGNLIKRIRKENNLTQKDLANKYGVTYQAVSKWENGTNLPDISLIKEISNDYNIDINDFLDGNNIVNKKKNINILLVIIIVVLIIGLIVLSVIHYNAHVKTDYSFKTLSTTCDIFKVTGSIAYDSKKSSIYLSNINYCGGDDNNKYDDITCNLYEDDKIVYSCDSKSNITLEDYLKELSIKVDNYAQTCKMYKDDSLFLQIDASKKSVTTTYKIPLKLDDDNC